MLSDRPCTEFLDGHKLGWFYNLIGLSKGQILSSPHIDGNLVEL